MFNVKVGTTNFDGTGSASNLTDSHIKLDKPNEGVIGDDFFAYEKNSTVVAKADYWNAPQAKEIQINGENINVTTTDFVDVDINLAGSDADLSIEVIDSKRGAIDTGAGNDRILVQVETNDAGWSNLFEVNSGDGNDTIIFQNSSNSQHTKLQIDTGNGDDVVDLTGLSANLIDASERVVMTGDGNDSVLGGAGHETIFAGAGEDLVMSGAGNDIIDGGFGADTIYAGAGNDTVFFDSADVVVNGGEGFDALVVLGGYNDVSNIENFEAIIGQKDSLDAVTAEMHDGLIVALGDGYDQITFTNADTFYASDAELTSEQLEFIDANNIDVDTLHAYETDAGDVVWSDVDLLA